MATPAERLAREARAIRRVEDPPPAWEAEFADESGVAVYAAELEGVDGRKQLLVPRSDATERQRRAFGAAWSVWERHGGERSIVPVVATGDEPRPWLALGPPDSEGRFGQEPLPEAAVRALLVDLAEGCWVIRRSPWDGVADPRQYRLTADGASAAVRWPLSVQERESPVVRTLGEIGYEALTGEEPATERCPLPQTIRSSGRYTERLCAVVETALAAPPARYANPYELKRALLFGPEAERTGDSHETEVSGRPMGSGPAAGRSESGTATAGHDGRSSESEKANRRETARGGSDTGITRRAVVGALGLSAIPFAGAFAARSPDDAAESPTPEPPDASFAFADEGTAIRVTHAGGNSIAADRLLVRNTRYSGIGNYEWAAFTTEDTVESGDTML
ncbi:MAG: hypothetical protein R6T83_08125 [Salinibacter sp.]